MGKFLVTGASGFLGTHLVEVLRKKFEHQGNSGSVRILIRGKNPWEGDPTVEAVYGDVLDRAAVERAIRGVSGVFHLAGFVTRNPAQAERLFQTHIEGTRNVCESALACGSPKIVLASSSGTIAASREPKIHDENSPYAIDIVARWPYYLSKISQEKLALGYHAGSDLPVVVVNPSLLLGPGDQHSSSTGDIDLFLKGKLTNVSSGGLNFLDVRDAAETLARAMDSGIPGHRYLLGGHNMTVKEFFLLIQAASGVRAPRLSLPERWSRHGALVLRLLYRLFGRCFPLDDVTIQMAYLFWYFDNSRAKTQLGLTPRPPHVTIQDTVEYLRHKKTCRACPREQDETGSSRGSFPLVHGRSGGDLNRAGVIPSSNRQWS
ncbi:MAG: NAD-dependent epimerase/dehydratase family protein [Acidobacteria bacterium]|nr:NAD-dependent epimerase/dehydratase family protein [Acidobacteriota bacterium]